MAFALSVLGPSLACSSAAEDGTEDFAGAKGDAPAGGAGDDGQADPTGDRGEDGGDSGGTGAPPPEPTPSAEDDGGTTGSTASAAPCPDPWPEGWVFCEDFESLTDPSEAFFEHADAEGAFSLVDHMGASGKRSMEAFYEPGREDAGLLLVSFGASPIDQGLRPAYAPGERFDEIWWRFRVRMEPGWPDQGPGRLTRAMAFASADWSEAYVAHLRSADGELPEIDAPTLEAIPQTCINDSASVACAGYDDMAGLESLGGLAGHTELFSSEAAGTWHCVEVHMRVNTLGQADGALEFWVDDVYENGREDLDWRGMWDGYGINAVAIENFWDGGAPAPLRRWIDDLVIATEPIGCE